MGLILLNNPRLYYRGKRFGEIQSFSANCGSVNDSNGGELYEFEIITNKKKEIKTLFGILERGTNVTLEMRNEDCKYRLRGKPKLLHYEDKLGNFKSFTLEMVANKKRAKKKTKKK